MLSSITITHLFDNYSVRTDLQTLWGYSVLIDTPGSRILFDTGSNGRHLLNNMELMNIDLNTINSLFITHRHWDHIGGIDSILEQLPEVNLIVPHTLSGHLISDLKKLAASVKVIEQEPEQLGPHIYTTGVMASPGSSFEPEQAVVLHTGGGLVLITGCAHPGIGAMVQWAANYFGQAPLLVMGGFHLLKSGSKQIEKEIDTLKSLNVHYVAPSHCTGDAAIEQFREAFQDRFIPDGAGQMIQVEGDRVSYTQLGQ